MTQPDRLNPDAAANHGPFSRFAAKTQEQWMEEQRGGVSTSLSKATTGFGKIGNDIRTIIRNIAQGLSGNNQVDFSLDDLFDNSWALKREQVQQAAGLAALQADVRANNNSGKTLLMTVSQYGTTFPSVLTIFDESGGGTLTNDGDTLEFSKDTGRKLFLYNVEPLATDHFEVSLIVPRPLSAPWGAYGSRAIYFIGRSDAAGDNYCLARLNGTKLRIGAVIDGVSTLDSPTWFESVTAGNPTEVTVTAGSYMTFRGGTVGGTKVFQFLVGNQVVATFEDDADVSLVGEDYRWVGAGLANDNNDVINRVANISHLMANDNEPAPVSGSYASICRLSTTQVTVTAGAHEVPSNFFDFENEVSGDITVNLTNGSFTVSESKPYLVAAGLKCGGSWPDHFKLVVFVDGLEGRHMSADFGFTSTALGGTNLPDAVHGSAPVYLTAGDVVTLGYLSDGTTPNALRGEATGNYTWFSIMAQ